ncbi:MAG: methyltransferase [Deltaproteobacteria bacterium]|nr:MAG: methyltransferase [Deltaproteobacteria bacterium]
MNRTAIALSSLSLLLAAGCGRGEPSPKPAPVDDVIAAMPEPGPAAVEMVTKAPPKMQRVGHPVPADHLGKPHHAAPATVAEPKSAEPAPGEAVEAPTAAADGAEPGCDHAGHGHGHAGAGHDPEHPPIDCPLAKTDGHAHHKPFEDVDAYIAHLDRADRAAWQKPDDVVAALGLTGKETVFDIGAGSGYFSFRFGKALPEGRVIAADTEPEMVSHLEAKAKADGAANVIAKRITTDDPGVTDDVDLVFICDVLHHVESRPAWMAKLVGEMKPGARLAIIEFKKEDLPVGPPPAMKMSRDETVELAKSAGLELVREDAELLPYQLLHVFKKP